MSKERSWKMYRHKKGVALYSDQVEGEAFGWLPSRQPVRYLVECTQDGNIAVYGREELLPHSGEDPETLYVNIRCVRNIAFAPDDEDLDPRQMAHSTLPSDRFNELYERV